MDSLNVTASITVGGAATGVSSDPELSTSFPLRLKAKLESGGTGASLGNQALWLPDRVLSSGANETHDLTDFTNALKEAGASLSKVRGYAIVHDAASAATSITVGNAATPYPGQLDTATTTRTLKPGEGFAELSGIVDGRTVTAGMGVKVVANGGNATYSIGVFGEA